MNNLSKHKSVKIEELNMSGYHKGCNCGMCKEMEENIKNEMPPMLLDDMIADWEHGNLVK